MGDSQLYLMKTQPAPFMRFCVAAALFAVFVLGALFITVQIWPQLIGYIQQMQNDLHRELATAVRAIKEQPGWSAGSLITLSFFYGIFHAAGPGHGKMIIATYLASHPAQIRQGLLLSALSSLAQGIVAIMAVGGSVWLLNLSTRSASKISGNLELTSYILVTVLGIYLSYTAFRKLRRKLLARGAVSHNHNHHHGHDHHHDVGCQHHHHGIPEIAPDPQSKQYLAMIASIGIRPCSGAVLVLIFAFALHLPWTGVVAVLVMSAGTAVTVSGLALLSITARRWAKKLAAESGRGAGYFGIISDTVALVGGLLIIALGISLVNAALAISNHPLL